MPSHLTASRCPNTLRGCACCCRALTALSTTLGQMVVALHQGLLAAVAQEPLLPVLAVVLRALCAILAAAPYDRLPQSLLPDLVTVGAPCGPQLPVPAAARCCPLPATLPDCLPACG
jgi:hypothetical protein